MKKKLEIGELDGVKVLLVDGEVFDWAIDEYSLDEANSHSSDKATMKVIHKNIRNYFLDCLGEVLGFRPSISRVNEGLRQGWIE
jgi:hypothetical protein